MRIILGGITAVVLAGAVLAGAGVARANVHGHIDDDDGDAYAWTLSDYGWLGTPSQAENIAIDVCLDRSRGLSEYVLGRRLHRIDDSLGGVAVGEAEFHFCPQYEMQRDGVTPAWVRNPNWAGGWAPNDPTIRGAIPGTL